MRKLVSLFILSLGLFAAPCLAASQQYYAPPQMFNASFKIMDAGLSNQMGLFEEGTGSFRFDADTHEISHLRIAISADSMTLPNRNALSDLRDLFDVSTYGEIVFAALAPAKLEDGKGEIKGTLTLHGKSKEATFTATLNKPTEGDRKALGLSLSGSFARADFDMGDPPEMLGRFGKDMALTLEMQVLRAR